MTYAMSRQLTMAVLASLLINRALSDGTCSQDEADLCGDDYYTCASDEGDLCDAATSTYAPGDGGGNGGTVAPGATVTTTQLCDSDEADLCDASATTAAPGDGGSPTPAAAATVTRTGSYQCTVTATALQTQTASAKALATKMLNQGVASSLSVALGYVTTTATQVTGGRRLAQIARYLQTSYTYSVAWSITTPAAKEAHLANTISEIITNTTGFESELVNQFQAAGVSVSSVSVSSFVAAAYYESDTSFASRMADSFSLALLALLSCFRVMW
jgi:hypothetical protein